MNETIPLPEALPELRETPRQPKRTPGLSLRMRSAIALALCVAAVLCKLFAPGSAAQLKRWIIGDGSEQLQQAVFGMERAIGEGRDLAEAWSAFCGELADEPA